MTEIYQPPKIQHPVRYGVPEDVHHFMDLCVYCAEENGLTEEAAIKEGMDAKAGEFRKGGAEIYVDTAK